MKLAVLGAGGIGGGVGARLHLAGVDVTLVARGAHLEAMRTRGLRLLEPARDERVPVTAAGHVPADADVVLLAVKSHDTSTALSLIPAGLTVVSLQNGLGNEEHVAGAGFRVIAAMVYVPAVYLEPGEVRLHGAPDAGRIDLGDWPSGAGELTRKLVEMLRAAGFTSDAREDIMRWKRGKLLTNLAGGLQAICDGVPEDLWKALCAEAEAVFEAAELDYVTVEELVAACPLEEVPVQGGIERPGGSTWQSIARGQRTERDALYGSLSRMGARLKVDTPLCRRLHLALGDLERGEIWTEARLRSR